LIPLRNPQRLPAPELNVSPRCITINPLSFSNFRDQFRDQLLSLGSALVLSPPLNNPNRILGDLDACLGERIHYGVMVPV